MYSFGTPSFSLDAAIKAALYEDGWARWLNRGDQYADDFEHRGGVGNRPGYRSDLVQRRSIRHQPIA